MKSYHDSQLAADVSVSPSKEPAAAEVRRYLSTLCTYLSEIAAFEVVMNNMYVFTINHI